MARKSRAQTDTPMVDESWRARDDLRTLSNAAEIGRDKRRLKAAQAEARRQMQALHSVAGGGRRGPRMGARAARRKRLEAVEL